MTLCMAFVVGFKNDDLEQLELGDPPKPSYPLEICRMYRKRMQMIRAAVDEREFYGMKSLRFEKLQGNRGHQHSMRLNDQWRLIVEITSSNEAKHLWVISIEDYH